MERLMPQPNDLSRSLVALDQDSTLVAVIEMGQASWLVAAIVPGINRHPLKKIATDQEQLRQVLRRWAKEAETAGRMIKRIAVAYEAGRDGFWLARWLRAGGVEAYVIHPSSVPVPREHRRAKTDRLDTELLKRAFLGWLRGEPDHCSMAAIPTLAAEDAKRPGRERENLVGERTRIVNRIKGALARLGLRNFTPMLRNAPRRLETLRTPEGAALRQTRWPSCGATWRASALSNSRSRRLRPPASNDCSGHPENQAMRWSTCSPGWSGSASRRRVQEVFSGNLRDRKAVARYAGLTGAPDESGKKRRERGLAKSGNARVRRGMLQIAWGFLVHQKDGALAEWYRARTADARGATRKTMIVALARKLLIALWRLATTGEVPEGLALRAAA
jgi:transposase